MNEKSNMHIVARHTKMCMSFFFHSYLNETKKSTVNSYDLIPNHFQAKLKGKQLWNKANFNCSGSARINLPTVKVEWLLIIELRAAISEMSKYRLFKPFSFVFYHCCFYAFVIFDSTLHCLQWRNARFCNMLFDIIHVAENRTSRCL